MISVGDLWATKDIYNIGKVPLRPVDVYNNKILKMKAIRIVHITMVIMMCLSNATHAQVAPLMSTTWNQGCNYNTDCPIVSGGPCGRAYTGCNATALAQIMKYYAHPSSAWGGIYTNRGTPVQTVNYDVATYNWSGMPNSLSSANAEVAKINYHAGVAVDMQYGAAVSNSYFESAALKKYFKYSLLIRGVLKANYTNTQWENLLKSELEAGRVVYVKSTNHFYVIDGYQISPSLKFHCNFGWGGLYDGYYDLHAIVVASNNYTPGQAVIGIAPLSSIEASPDTVVAVSNAGTVNYEISSLGSWTATSNQTWCSLGSSSGVAGYYNSARSTLTSNLSYTPRYATLTYQSGTRTVTVVVKQNGITPALAITPNDLTYSAVGESQNVSISSDSSWVATTTFPWISISPANGVGNGSVMISANPNGPVARTGNVTLSRGSIKRNVSIFQSASGSFWCTPAMATTGSNGITKVSLKTINRTSVNNEAYINTGLGTTLKIDSAYTISVTFIGSNAPGIWIDWNIDGDFNDPNEAVMPGSGIWYPSFAGTKNLSFNVPSSAVEGTTRMRVYAKNFGTGPVSSPCNITDVGGDMEDYNIVIVNHKRIQVSPTVLNYINANVSQNVSVISDSNWRASTTAAWITLSPNSGSGTGTVGITTTTNSTLRLRNDIVTFTRGSKTKTVTINQNPADTVLTVSPATIKFVNTGGINSFAITSNSIYNLVSNKTWITSDVILGNGNLVVNVNVASNPTNVIRSGSITVVSGTYSKVVTITQDSTSSLLTVSRPEMNYTDLGGKQSVTLTTPSSWNATASDTWFSINQNSGIGNFTMDVSCVPNLTNNSRAGTITISNGVSTRIIAISQEGIPIPTSVVDLASGNWTIHPNPTSGTSYLNSFEVSETRGFVYNALGEVVQTLVINNNEMSTIDLSKASNGIYFVALVCQTGQTQFLKLIKE
jgi:hypothetical protein